LSSSKSFYFNSSNKFVKILNYILILIPTITFFYLIHPKSDKFSFLLFFTIYFGHSILPKKGRKMPFCFHFWCHHHFCPLNSQQKKSQILGFSSGPISWRLDNMKLVNRKEKTVNGPFSGAMAMSK
jgi:hypothetical protein